ncbi:MAG: baseplate hub protein [Acidimicrobiales bacterium]
MTALFGRVVEVIVGDAAFTDLRVSFRAERAIRPSPSPAEIRVYNLDPTRRNAAVQAATKQGVRVRLQAGYKTVGLAQIFDGDVRTARIEKQGPDVVLVLSGSDGLLKLRQRAKARSFASETQVADVLRRVVSDSGLGPGNLEAAIRAIGNKTIGDGGLALSGDVSTALSTATGSAGLQWSVQDGQLVILGSNEARSGQAVKLSPETGLIGLPSEDAKQELRATSLLNPDLLPGRLLVLDSPELSGNYRIEGVTYDGDTHGQNWYAQVRGKRL